MAVISYKCPNCGGDLRFDPLNKTFRCEYCDSEYSEEQMQKLTPDDNNEEETQERYETITESGKNHGARIYSCPNCGAEIITDETTAATFCYYCHNPVVFQGQLSGEYQPDRIIPFSIDKKTATEKFLKYVKKKRFVPKDFFCKEQIEKFTGVYFPFWMYSCEMDSEWHGTGDTVRIYQAGDVQYTETKIFEIDRNAELSFEKITRNALNRENRQLVESVQPFRLDQTEKFQYGYLSGFQAEKRDIEKTDLETEISEEVKKHASAMVQGSVKNYQNKRVLSEYQHIHDEKWKYLLVPVWVVTYQGRNGKKYFYAMNGQTGKVSGILPLDRGKLTGLFVLLSAVITALFMLGGYFLW